VNADPRSGDARTLADNQPRPPQRGLLLLSLELEYLVHRSAVLRPLETTQFELVLVQPELDANRVRDSRPRASLE
jgi:hypothetical protein